MLPLTPLDIFLRLGAAFIAGGLLGLERETHGRPAGLRTTILTCLAAASAAILATQFTVLFHATTPGSINSDPGRLVAGVLTGIGFLGAGTIMRQGSLVRGVTTAAVLWLSTIIGLVIGGGQWSLALMTLVFAGLALLGLPKLEDHIAHNAYALVTITIQGNEDCEATLRQTTQSCGAQVQSMDFSYDFAAARRVVMYQIKFKSSDTYTLATAIAEKLKTIPGVVAVAWE